MVEDCDCLDTYWNICECAILFYCYTLLCRVCIEFLYNTPRISGIFLCHQWVKVTEILYFAFLYVRGR